MGSDMMIRIPYIYMFINQPNKQLVDEFWTRWKKFNDKRKEMYNANDYNLFNTLIDHDVYGKKQKTD